MLAHQRAVRCLQNPTPHGTVGELKWLWRLRTCSLSCDLDFYIYVFVLSPYFYACMLKLHVRIVYYLCGKFHHCIAAMRNNCNPQAQPPVNRAPLYAGTAVTVTMCQAAYEYDVLPSSDLQPSESIVIFACPGLLEWAHTRTACCTACVPLRSQRWAHLSSHAARRCL